MKSTTNPALEREALFAKSQVYIRRGLRAQAARDVDEYQLWASLALELLGKAALSRVHPALVADPTHTESLFAACGRHLSADIKTITAKALFSRLTHIDKAFDSRHQKFCEQLSLRRNAELHSGESPFSGMSAEAWEREFWGAIETLLRMQAESLDSWLGAENAKVPTKILKQAKEALQWAVKNRIARCKEDFLKTHQDPKQRQQVINRSKFLQVFDGTRMILPGFDGFAREKCAACGSGAFLGGTLWNEEVIAADPGYEHVDDQGNWWGEPPSETIEKTFSTEEFICPTCGLRFSGTKEIAAADLPEDFVEREERIREFEPDYGND